jgi:hypothetical protein
LAFKSYLLESQFLYTQDSEILLMHKNLDESWNQVFNEHEAKRKASNSKTNKVIEYDFSLFNPQSRSREEVWNLHKANLLLLLKQVRKDVLGGVGEISDTLPEREWFSEIKQLAPSPHTVLFVPRVGNFQYEKSMFIGTCLAPDPAKLRIFSRFDNQYNTWDCPPNDVVKFMKYALSWWCDVGVLEEIQRRKRS